MEIHVQLQAPKVKAGTCPQDVVGLQVETLGGNRFTKEFQSESLSLSFFKLTFYLSALHITQETTTCGKRVAR